MALNAYGDRTGEEILGLAGWPAGLIGNWWAAEEDRADLQRAIPACEHAFANVELGRAEPAP